MPVLKRWAPVPGGAKITTEEQTEEGRLLASLFAGDRRAAEELAHRTYELVYASLFRLCGGDADLSADLTQETYRKAWKALSSFNGRCQFSTWLYRIAYNTFLNHVRRPNRLLPLEPESELKFTDPTPTHEERLSSKQLSERLRRRVLGLPEELRVTVTARFWGELPVKEIAEMEGVTPVAIRKRLKRAFKTLRLSFEEEVS